MFGIWKMYGVFEAVSVSGVKWQRCRETDDRSVIDSLMFVRIENRSLLQ